MSGFDAAELVVAQMQRWPLQAFVSVNKHSASFGSFLCRERLVQGRLAVAVGEPVGVEEKIFVDLFQGGVDAAASVVGRIAPQLAARESDD